MFYLLSSVFNFLTLSLFVFFSILCACVYSWSKKSYSFFMNLGLPYEEPKIFIGSLRNYPLISKNKHQFYFVEDIYKKHDGKTYVGMFKFRKPMLMIRDPDICYQVLTKYFGSFQNRPGAPVDTMKDPLSNHLINMHGDEWKAVRSRLSPAFTPSKLKKMFCDMMECVVQLSDHIENELYITDEFQLMDLFSQFDLKVSGKCILGLDTATLNDPNSKFYSIFKSLLKPTVKTKYKQIFQFLFPQNSKFVETKNISEETYKFLANIIKDVKNESRADKRHDFVKLLTGLLKTDVDDSVILSNVFIFLTTGYESTSSTIASALYELALNPTIQEKVRQEVQEHNSEWSYNNMTMMKYLELVIYESQRIHPVNTSLSRQCTAQEFKLPGTDIYIPRGTHICIPTFAMYKDPRYFPEPDRFNPERFSEERSRQFKMFSPFGEGPRQCLAKSFALLEVKTVISYLISKFKFVPCSKTKIPLSYVPDKLFITPVNGIWIRFEKLPNY